MAAADATSRDLFVIWVDFGFSRENFAQVIRQICQAQVEVVCRTEPGFVVLPKRWIVERTFAGVESIPPFEQRYR